MEINTFKLTPFQNLKIRNTLKSDMNKEQGMVASSSLILLKSRLATFLEDKLELKTRYLQDSA